MLSGMARLKVHFVAPVQHIVAHDFNNELGLIIAECDLLETTLTEEETTALSRVRAIKRSALRLANMFSTTRSAFPSPLDD